MKKYKILIGIVIFLTAIRLILPYGVLFFCNRYLAQMKGYSGRIDSVGLSIYRGAYKIYGLNLNKVDEKTSEHVHFFSAKKIDLSIEWKALLHGSIVGSVTAQSPDLVFTKDKVELKDVKQASDDYRRLFKKLMPLRVNRLEIIDGSMHYTDNNSSPKIDISLKKIDMTAYNLSNAYVKKVELPSTIKARAELYEGVMVLNMRLNALAEKPTFELKAEINDTNLVLLNDFLRAYGKFDVSRGKFSLDTEMASKNGKFVGYVKPFIKDLKVLGPKDRGKTFLHKAWEALLEVSGAVFKNPRTRMLATRVPLEGNYEDPNIGVVEAVWRAFSNAFIKAIEPGFDEDININSRNEGRR